MKKSIVSLMVGIITFTIIFTGCRSNVSDQEKQKAFDALDSAQEKIDDIPFINDGLSWLLKNIKYGVENDIGINGKEGWGFPFSLNGGDIVQWALKNDRDNLDTPIIHQVYKKEIITDAHVLSVYNYSGDIHVKKSQDDKFRVNVTLEQIKNINDLDIKLDNLGIKPQTLNGVMFLEPLTRDGTKNYWKWVEENLNANGIQINFNLEIPKTIYEIRLIGDIGNIIAEDITAKVYMQTDIGNIACKNISILDKGIFKTSLPTSSTGIDIEFSDLRSANEIIATTSDLKDISLTLPRNTKYTHNENAKSDNVYEDEKIYDFLKGGLEVAKDLNDEVTISTSESEEFFSNVSIQQ